MKVNHELKAVYNKNSKVLLLGSMPSIKSRETGFYYAHPQNRFWKTLTKVYDEEMPLTTEEKINFVYKHNIALFDVIKSCDITSSSDSSIKNVVPNDLTPILKKANIKAIFTLGKKSYNLYQKYIYPKTKIEAIYLPSTSPANCPKGIDEKLYNAFLLIKKYTDML